MDKIETYYGVKDGVILIFLFGAGWEDKDMMQ